MKHSIKSILMGALFFASTQGYARQLQQPVPGRVTLRNDTQEEIEVYFFATRKKKSIKEGCRPFIRIIPPLSQTTINPRNCIINVIEVHHTPEEEYEQTTKEFISKEDQRIETTWIYKGPNIIVQLKYKTAQS
jgi:hypothetical protein